MGEQFKNLKVHLHVNVFSLKSWTSLGAAISAVAVLEGTTETVNTGSYLYLPGSFSVDELHGNS